MNNKSARLYGKEDLRLEDVQVPELGPNDVLIKMAFVGICHSDVHFFDEGGIERFIVTQPLTIGHELSGVVSKVGAEVSGVQVSDRVAIDNIRPCFECRHCQIGRYTTCSSLKCAGVPPTDGGCSRYMVTPAYTCHKLPENVSLEAAAFMEPLSVAVNGLHRGKVAKGEVVIVIGAGTIGLLTMQAAKALGASKVLVVDINPKRLELATLLGADATFNSTGITDPKTAGEAIKQSLGEDADMCVECSGAPGTLDIAIHACRIGGRVVVLGIGDMAMYVHIGMAALREIDIIGALCNNHNFPESVQLVSNGKVNVKPLISHVLTLDQLIEGLDLVRNGANSIKVLIDCQK